MKTTTRQTCSQCGKWAIVTINDAALCVGCYHTFEVAQTLAFRMNAIHLNHAAAELDSVLPFGPPTPRMQVPDIPKGPMILNNIKVDNSVVGTINTGNVHSIDVNISYLRNSGSEKLSEALRTLAETIANEKSINPPEKNSALDQVAFLSEQAAAAAKNRRLGLIQASFKSVNELASTVSNVNGAWAVAEPLLRTVFGF